MLEDIGSLPSSVLDSLKDHLTDITSSLGISNVFDITMPWSSLIEHHDDPNKDIINPEKQILDPDSPDAHKHDDEKKDVDNDDTPREIGAFW